MGLEYFTKRQCFEMGLACGGVAGIGSSGPGQTETIWNYTKNYGNLTDWAWVYDAVWDDSTTKKGCLLNKEDWPRFVYIWYYENKYRATFFNYLEDVIDEFTNTKGTGYFWNIDRSLTCVSYVLDIVDRKILSASGQSRGHGFDTATHINTNSEELFNFLGSMDAWQNRYSFFMKCDRKNFWSNWGGFVLPEPSAYSGVYGWVMSSEKRPLDDTYYMPNYYIWLWNGEYRVTYYESFNNNVWGKTRDYKFNPVTKIINHATTGSMGSHGWYLVKNIETTSQNMLDFVHKNYPNTEDANWHNLSTGTT